MFGYFHVGIFFFFFFFFNDTATTEIYTLSLHDALPIFSPNVLLRPIVQDTLFPTVCYVGGPSELAYLGQLGGVYEQFGVPMPLMYPRASATLVDSASLRFLTKYAVPIEALQAQDEAALNDLLKS